MPEFEQWIASLAVGGLEHEVVQAIGHKSLLSTALADLHNRVSMLEEAEQMRQKPQDVPDAEQSPAL